MYDLAWGFTFSTTAEIYAHYCNLQKNGIEKIVQSLQRREK